jgi:hypothetical protein
MIPDCVLWYWCVESSDSATSVNLRFVSQEVHLRGMYLEVTYCPFSMDNNTSLYHSWTIFPYNLQGNWDTYIQNALFSSLFTEVSFMSSQSFTAVPTLLSVPHLWPPICCVICFQHWSNISEAKTNDNVETAMKQQLKEHETGFCGNIFCMMHTRKNTMKNNLT